MALTASQVSVADSATSLVDAGVAGRDAAVANLSTVSVFLGPAGVTTANGYELEAGQTLRLALRPGDELFAVVATGSETVHVLSA